MQFRAPIANLLLLSITHIASAQIGPDPTWLNPNGSVKDFTSDFQAGTTITLAWKAFDNSTWDLWLTHWNQGLYPWDALVAENIDLSTAGTYNWTIDIPAFTIDNDNAFVLRFLHPGVQPGVWALPQHASPGFNLTVAAKAGDGGTTNPQTSTTQTITTATHTATVPSGLVSSTPSASSSASSPSSSSTSSSSSGLSLGAQIGIGVGVGISVIALFIAGCFFGRRFGTHKNPRNSQDRFEKEGFALQSDVSRGYSNASTGRYEVNGEKNPQFSQGSYPSKNTDSAAYTQIQQWQTSPSHVEAGGCRMHPVEADGTMVQSGPYELG